MNLCSRVFAIPSILRFFAMPPFLRFFVVSFFWLPPLAATAQADAAAAQERYLFELLRAGGWTMVPLALCLLGALYLLVYCWRETSPRCFFVTVPPAPEAPTDSATLFDRALARGLSKIKGISTTADRTAAENAIGETLAHAEAEQLRWIGYLNIIAAIAPMIGLLGTVSGMIGAFGTISAGGMGRPEMLAGNIGEALVSTATGLAVGIPAMLCYHVLHNRLGLRMNETVSRLNDALDAHFKAEDRGG